MRLSPPFLSFAIAALTCPAALGADALGADAPGADAPAPTSPGPPSDSGLPADDEAPAMTSADDAPPPKGPTTNANAPATTEASPPRSSASETDTTVPPDTNTESPPADDSENKARAAFLEGDRFYLEGDYQGAVKSFERAYALSGRIEMLFNLANAHERLGNYARASVALRGYIPHCPPQHRAALEKRLARFEILAQKRREKDEKTAEVVKELKENPRPFPVGRTVGIGLLTLGSASILTGVGFGVSALSARANLNDNCESGPAGRLCSPDSEKDLQRDRAHSTVADVAVVAGVVGASLGTVLLIHSKNKERKRLELDVGFGPSRLSLEGRF